MKVKLHSNEKSAANLTDITIKQLPGNGCLKRNSNGEIDIDEDGLATVEGDSSGFLAFALKNQGYVKEVIE